MLLLWVFITTASLTSCHKVFENTEDTDPDQNTTTLYPVSNTTQTTAETKTKTDVTSWKIQSTFAESKLPKDSNGTDTKEELVVESKETANGSKQFRPSPHVGFIDDVEPTRETFDAFSPVIKKPPSGFVGFPEDYKSKAKDIFKNYQKFPYKFESAIFTKTKPWQQNMETRPTVEVPVKVPAGGLYQLPDPFREKPSAEEFGLEFNSDIKENAVKKRPNPWKKILHLITALIPVGILVSALTPSVLTIHSTGTGLGPDQLSSNIFRSTDAAIGTGTGIGQLPAISERCRRRLLCELHSDTNYAQKAHRRGKQCYRISCEDPEALGRTLRWILTYHQPGPEGHT